MSCNFSTLLVQVIVTRGLLHRFGVAPVLMIPAVAVLLGFSVLTASPLPLLVAVVQVMTRAGEFSLMKPARETLYTRVSREARYKAKAAIDTVVYRAFGDKEGLAHRSEEHTSELQSLMRISYDGFCLKK